MVEMIRSARGRGLVIAALAMAGCDAVLGLTRTENAGPGDAPAGDGARTDGQLGLVDAAPLPTCDVDGQELTLPVLADTYLDQDGPHGDGPVLRVAQGKVLMVAFQTGNLKILRAHLTLTRPVLSRACGTGGGCGQCPSDTAGPVQAFWVRTDWDELTADRDRRDPATLWEQPFASGVNDRSGNLGSSGYDGNQLDVTRDFYPSDRHADWPQEALGVLVAPESSASSIDAMFASKDARDCAGVTVPGPTLKVICQR